MTSNEGGVPREGLAPAGARLHGPVGAKRESGSYGACVETPGQTSQVVRGQPRNAAAEHRAGPRAAPQRGPGGAVSGAPRSPTRLGGQLFGPGAAGAAVQAVGSRRRLQVLQALSEGQFLLDGHPQQRVERLLLVLRRGQLPLHLVQLGHVLVTPETREKKGLFKAL